MRVLFALFFVAASLAPAPAFAGPILDRIRAEGVVRCGGVERPGLIAVEDGGKAAGLELDLCRAIASVALGPNGRLEFRRYDSEKAFGEVRAGKDDVSFLTGREMIDNGLTGKMIAGPAIFVETMAVMVPSDSPAPTPRAACQTSDLLRAAAARTGPSYELVRDAWPRFRPHGLPGRR